MLPETKESLEDSGFLLPGEDRTKNNVPVFHCALYLVLAITFQEFLDLSTVKQEVKSEEPESKDVKAILVIFLHLLKFVVGLNFCHFGTWILKHLHMQEKRVVPRAPKMQEVKEAYRAAA